MKRVWIVTSVVAALSIAVVLTATKWRTASSLEGIECIDGDVNGDGALNITDPIHLLSFLFVEGEPPTTCRPEPAPMSLVVLVRHAEKESGTTDPGLTEAGRERARRLAEVLEPTPVDYLLASDMRRTQETLAPLAELKTLEIEQLPTGSEVVERLRALPAGSVVVVAHHSFTIPVILQELGVEGREAVTVSGDHYDTFLVLLVDGGSRTRMLHLKY